MRILAFLIAGGAGLAAATQEVISCSSENLKDGDFDTKEWRVSTHDCAEATNQLEKKFSDTAGVTLPSNGCINVTRSDQCEISICDVSNVRDRKIGYYELWAAARVIHARHKKGGQVAGYVPLNDWTSQERWSAYVKVAKKDTPDPVQKSKKEKRALLNYFEQHEEKRAAALQELASTSTAPTIATRVQDNYINMTEVAIPNPSGSPGGLTTNIQVGWGTGEFVERDQMEYVQERLVELRRQASRDGTNPNVIRPAGYYGRHYAMIEMEYVAHNNHNARDLGDADLNDVIRFAINERIISGNWSNFIMQIRRGGQSIGHLLIQIIRFGANNPPPALAMCNQFVG
ncbi:hypothetical protein B0H66DRAFT_526378 [Apodospora peruviana]|uniref:Uncharacterized protein n=1 Tax=Apodospora peruviana TaxID=516989 RepID=A0AAE0ME86_9PEZI|nr:hypothetical protein B0H66DRAFT_526378 [Apodospora peruviana]